jgi:putative spermidine/putrescine transport system ATP-binding protein
MVALGYGARKPAQLSGGQRQRVALARALVNRRACCCSTNRSAPRPQAARADAGELKKLQRQLGITFIFVTHDQTEALSMSDRVAVFNRAASNRSTPRATCT